jgi:hypothetical protein
MAIGTPKEPRKPYNSLPVSLHVHLILTVNSFFCRAVFKANEQIAVGRVTSPPRSLTCLLFYSVYIFPSPLTRHSLVSHLHPTVALSTLTSRQRSPVNRSKHIISLHLFLPQPHTFFKLRNQTSKICSLSHVHTETSIQTSKCILLDPLKLPIALNLHLHLPYLFGDSKLILAREGVSHGRNQAKGRRLSRLICSSLAG